MIRSKTVYQISSARRGAVELIVKFHGLISASVARWAPIPLRLIVGSRFVEHGFATLLGGSIHFTGVLQAMGVPAPKFVAILAIVTEIVSGFGLELAALARLISIPMAVVLLVAIFTVDLQYGFASTNLQAIEPAGARFGQPGYETDLLYLACLIALQIWRGWVAFD
jgi:putative oxidoreductase